MNQKSLYIKHIKRIFYIQLPFSMYLSYIDYTTTSFFNFISHTAFFTLIFPFSDPVASIEFIDRNIYNHSPVKYDALFSKHKR